MKKINRACNQLVPKRNFILSSLFPKTALGRAPSLSYAPTLSRTLNMRAMTVAPGVANSAKVEDVPDPPKSDGAVLVRALALGVCGTDREIVSGAYGWAPPGEKRLGVRPGSLGEECGGPTDRRVRPV